MSDNISVVVRVRPLLTREKDSKIFWKVADNTINQLCDQEKFNSSYNFGKKFAQDFFTLLNSYLCYWWALKFMDHITPKYLNHQVATSLIALLALLFFRCGF